MAVLKKKMMGGGMAKMSKKKMMRGGKEEEVMNRAAVRYLGWGLLYVCKFFSAIANWFWKKHKHVLDWND